MMTEAELNEAAETLWRGFREVEAQPALSITYPEMDVEDAYKVAETFVAHREAEGHRVRGYKVGLTSKPMQEIAGSTEPDFGALLDFFFVPESSTLKARDFIQPMVEIEIAFVMKEALRGPGVHAADVIRATDFVVPAIELVDFRLDRKERRKGIFDTVADLASCGKVIMGGNPMRLEDADIRTVHGSLIKNGTEEAAGYASAVLGNPVNAIAWLANKLGELGGVTFEPGHVILSGSFIKVAPVAAGDEIVARFDSGFGDVALSFE